MQFCFSRHFFFSYNSTDKQPKIISKNNTSNLFDWISKELIPLNNFLKNFHEVSVINKSSNNLLMDSLCDQMCVSDIINSFLNILLVFFSKIEDTLKFPSFKFIRINLRKCWRSRNYFENNFQDLFRYFIREHLNTFMFSSIREYIYPDFFMDAWKGFAGTLLNAPPRIASAICYAFF